MKLSKIFALLLALCLISSAACAATFTDAHGNVIELDDSLEAYAAVTLVGADNAARQGEWTASPVLPQWWSARRKTHVLSLTLNGPGAAPTAYQA